MSRHSLYWSSTSPSNVSSTNTKINDMVRQLDRESIRSIVVGVVKIIFNELDSTLAHTSLLLSKNRARDLERGIGDGILIEYGYYLPNKGDEKKYVNDGLVKYRYGEEGGLRYYMQDISEFIKTQAGLCYVCLDIGRDNQITFSYFLDKIAPQYSYEWTNSKYHATDLREKHHNCQTFVARALNEVLIPSEYNKNMVIKGENFPFFYGNDAENKIPKDVLDALKNYQK